MTDYLEELLEAWAEEQGDEETAALLGTRLLGERLARAMMAPSPPPAGGTSPEGGGGEAATGAARGGKNLVAPSPPPVGGTSPGGGGKEGQSTALEWPDESGGVYGARGTGVEALRGRLRRGSAAAAYRAVTPAFLETAERNLVREKSLTELDAAFRRDARRYDGGFELY